MKRVERPNGYFQTSDPISGRKIEGETRSCVHCGYMWIYSPQSFHSLIINGPEKRAVRGKCLRCFGMVCARRGCLKAGCVPLMKQIAEMEGKQRSTIIT